jgi:hypothetical protein
MGHHSQAATVGCAECGEFHAFDSRATAEGKLKELLAREPYVDHSHEGLAIVWKDWDDLW